MRAISALLVLSATVLPAFARAESPPPPAAPAAPSVLVREVQYAGTLSEQDARFTVTLDLEALTREPASVVLFEGDVAVLTSKLPSGVAIVRNGQQYRLSTSRAGRHQLQFDIVAKITRVEPWDTITFTGPAAAIAAVTATAPGAGVELQLLGGTVLETTQDDSGATVRGFLAADRKVALRWQSRGREAERRAVTTCATTITAQVTPTVIKLVTALRYEILQGSLPQLEIALPEGQALTKVEGAQIRDWRVAAPGAEPATPPHAGASATRRLTIEFIKPVEKSYELRLFTEQTVETTPFTTALLTPQPQAVGRESGTITVSTEDTVVEFESLTGLQQINPPAGSVAAYRFFGRPFTVTVTLRRIEPVIETSTRVSLRVEEARLLATQGVTLKIEKAGIYAVELGPLAGFTVADVKGEGVEDWRAADDKLRVTFGSRVLGQRTIEVRLEKALGTPRFAMEPLQPGVEGRAVRQAHGPGPEPSRGAPASPSGDGVAGAPPSSNTHPSAEAVGGAFRISDPIALSPLRAADASKETAQIGVVAAAGLRLKTAEMIGLREIPVTQLVGRADESLAYTSEQADWKLTLSSERLAARVLADIFNLVTIGDGLVGGSATIRYAIINQGVQEFAVELPAGWKNVEFTGPNIRRKEQRLGTADPASTQVWLIGLQDKAWGGYTLVVTYDFAFDPHQAKLAIGGAHARGVERETGSIAITSAANLEIRESTAAAVQRIDERELATNDRALITRPVLLAYRYAAVRGSPDPAPLPTSRPRGLPDEGGDGDRSVETSGGVRRPSPSDEESRDKAYDLTVAITRFEELSVLQAVADRTQLTTVLTDAGQLLTQASFMVKNNAKQFQRFELPAQAEFWACYVANEPVKPERDGAAVLVPLPRGTNRDQAVPVEIVYAQKIGPLKSAWPRTLALAAPQTDMQTTYAEWEVFVPKTHDLAGFGGNMTVARGTTYGLRDAWQRCLRFYRATMRETAVPIVLGFAFVLVLVLVLVGVRFGSRRLVEALVLVAVFGILASMLLPSLSVSRKLAAVNTNLNGRDLIPPDSPASVVAPALAPEPSRPEELQRKLNQIILPQVSLRDTDLRDAVRYLEAQSRQFDPEGRGVSIRFDAPVAVNGVVTESDSEIPARRVSVTLRQIPLVDALRLITTAAGMKFRVEDSQVVLMAKDAPEGDMITQSYPVRPAIIRSVLTTPEGAGEPSGTEEFRDMVGGGAVTAPEDVKKLFADAGVPFPPGSSLVYNERANRIIVRNTPENMEIFDDVLSALGETPAAAELPSARPTATGIRPIRIDIPRTGTRFVFTKVLNVGDEALAVRAWATSILARNMARSTAQAALFLAGLAVVWWQLRVTSRTRSLAVAIGAALVIVGVGSFLVTTRTLHVAFVLVPPLIGLALLVGLVRRLAKRNGTAPAAQAAAPPAVAGLLLLFLAAGPVEAGSVAIRSADYTGSVGEKVAEFEGVLEVSADEANQSLQLFGDDVALREVTTSGGWFAKREVKLVREDGRLRVLLSRAGATTLRLKFIVPVGGDVTKRSVTFGLPAALSSKLTLTINEPEAAVEFPSAIAVKTTTEDQQTRVVAVVGSGERVDLRWTPRVKRAEEMAATVFCQNATLVVFGGGVVQTRARLEYQVTQGELRQARVRLPAGQRLLRVEGERLRTWDVTEEAGGSVLAIEFLRPVSSGSAVVLVTTEKVLGELPGTLTIATPQALDVKRETGWIGLTSADDLSVSVGTAEGLQRVDATEFSQAAALTNQPVQSAYRYLRADYQLTVRAETVQPQLEAVVRHLTTIGADQIGLTAQLDYTIKKAGVFGLRFALPVGYVVEAVTGDKVQQWTEKNGELEVVLKEKTIGTTRLAILLRRRLTELPKSVAVVSVHPLGVQKLTGYVAVSAETGLIARAERATGLTEIPSAEVPGGVGAPGGVLAYKYILTDGAAAAPWTLAVTTETVEPWVRAEVVNWLTFNPATLGLVNGRSVIRYEIANAPVNELRVRVPAAFRNVEVQGANIRRRDQTGTDWKVQLQNKALGTYTLTVTWEQPWDNASGALVVAGVEALGVEREVGAVAVDAQSPLQVRPGKGSDDLLPIDVRELPAWAGRANPNTVLAWRYLRPGYTLPLRVQRFEEAAVLQALADNVQLRTVIAEDGQMMTELTVAVRNNGRQYLAIGLPADAEVWSAFVAGRAVRPSRREGRVLLPLDRSGADGAPVKVQLTYVGKTPFPKGRGPVALVSPTLDVPLKDARWELFLPPEYSYAEFRGTMTPETAAPVPVVQTFSYDEYQMEEGRKASEMESSVLENLGRARQLLRGGKVKEAQEAYSQTRGQQMNWREKDADFEDLKLDLRRAQASNVNPDQAQFGQDFTIAGAAQQNAELAEAGARQWDKLEAAQELAVAQVLPLQVSLPTRGVRHAFTQVLQTEVGAPMTLSLVAANAKGVSWPARLVLGIGGFVVLWALVGWALGRRLN